MRTLCKLVLGFLHFWYDFIIGDCWQLALGVAVILAAGAMLAHFGAIGKQILPIGLATALMAMVVLSTTMEWWRKIADKPADGQSHR